MIPGYDCPHEAVYLPATTSNFEGSITRDRAICIFEQDPGRPLTRHTGYAEGEFGATRGYQLVVRSISTVGNSTSARCPCASRPRGCSGPSWRCSGDAWSPQRSDGS